MQRCTMSSAMSVSRSLTYISGRPPGEVGKRHREYRHFLELPQPFDLPLRIVGGQAFGARGEFARESAARGGFVECLGIDQFIQQQGKVGDLPRQESADRANIDQPVERRGLLLEKREVR